MQRDDERAFLEDSAASPHSTSQRVAGLQQLSRPERLSPADEGNGARRGGKHSEVPRDEESQEHGYGQMERLTRESDSEALGIRDMLKSRDKSGRRRFPDTPLMLESQVLVPGCRQSALSAPAHPSAPSFWRAGPAPRSV